MKWLLAVLVLVAAFSLNGGIAFPQSNLANLDMANAQLEVIKARAEVLKSRDEVQQWRPIVATYEGVSAPLPALPVPPVMTDKGPVQAPTPQPLPNFPVAKPQPVAKPLPAVAAPPIKTESGVAQTPNPRPTADFPVAKPQGDKPAIEIKSQVMPEVRPAVGVAINKTAITVVVNPPAFESGEDKKIATRIRPGELLLVERKNGIWKAETRKTNEVPQGYVLREGKENGS